MSSIFLYRGMFFGFYDTGKSLIPDFKHMSFWQKYLFAQAVTIVSEFLVYPFDTIRRRMMMNAGLEKKLFQNSWDCYKKILDKEGVQGFFKGNMSNMIRSVGSSLVLVLYDEL